MVIKLLSFFKNFDPELFPSIPIRILLCFGDFTKVLADCTFTIGFSSCLKILLLSSSPNSPLRIYNSFCLYSSSFFIVISSLLPYSKQWLLIILLLKFFDRWAILREVDFCLSATLLVLYYSFTLVVEECFELWPRDWGLSYSIAEDSDYLCFILFRSFGNWVFVRVLPDCNWFLILLIEDLIAWGETITGYSCLRVLSN